MGEIRFNHETVERFAASLDLSSSSVASYKKCLAYFFDYLADRGIGKPEAGHVAGYREALTAAGRRPSTVYNYLIAVRAFFQWTHAQGLYPNIAGRVKIPRVDHAPSRRTLTGAQLKTVLSSIGRESIRGLRDYAILTVMLTGGLSSCEVSRANVGDAALAREGGTLSIRGGDGELRGAVRLPSRVVEALAEYLGARGPVEPDAPLFASVRRRDGHMSRGSVNRIVKEALRNAGFDDAMLSAQSLKFTAVRLALQGGERLEDVQRFARHKNIRTTFRYREQSGVTSGPEKTSCGEEIARAVLRAEKTEDAGASQP
ncbi:MAG: tyrosine-type recombinase/integrase [Fretibacterium sp.]|nr:tyrosine-type recombinase/integrase [Fretibacterium sp.]